MAQPNDALDRQTARDVQLLLDRALDRTTDTQDAWQAVSDAQHRLEDALEDGGGGA